MVAKDTSLETDQLLMTVASLHHCATYTSSLAAFVSVGASAAYNCVGASWDISLRWAALFQ